MVRYLVLSLLGTAMLMPTAMKANYLFLPPDTAKCQVAVCAPIDSTKEECTKAKATSEYEKLLKKGGTELEGLFIVRHIQDSWYWEVPENMLGRMMLVVTRFSAVPENFKMFAGEEVNHSTVWFERRDDKTLLLREFAQTYHAPESDNIAGALSHSTISPIIHKFDVIGKNPDTGAYLVNVSKFILGEGKILSFTSKDKQIVELGSPVADRSFIDTLKTYPINMEIQTTRTYTMTNSKSTAAATGFATVGLTTSIVLLPETPMQARLADERVGYFHNPVTQFADHQQKVSKDFIVSRYRLEPKDPERYRKGLLTEPKKQIVYYIDPATPAKWVPYLKAGINDWNKAFEAAGFKNAIVGKEWPDDPTMSLDDARYSVIRYLPSANENAYGPRIVDPRSGEIIEAHVCWYHNVMNLVRKWYSVQCGAIDKRALNIQLDDKLMGELIRFVSSHEVGHSLGLRHNMIASNATPVEKLRDKAWVEKHGHAASIMDYARFNYVAQPEDGISSKGLFPRINDYDLWAIKWGYQYRPEFKSPYDEKPVLRKEVTKALTGNVRLRYVGDEGKGFDPRSQIEDLGDNSAKASDYGIKNLKRIMKTLVNFTAQPDGQYDELEELHKAIRAQFSRYCNHVQKNLGGRYFNNWPADRRYDYIPRERQKEVVDWFARNVFTAPLWLYPDEVISRLGLDADDEMRNRQNTCISFFLAPGMLFNLHNNALNSSDPYPVDEYLNDVMNAVWQPLTASDARQNNFRRLLQNQYVHFLSKLVKPTEKDLTGLAFNAYRSDVYLYARQHLDAIETTVTRLLSTASPFDALHFKRILDDLSKLKEEKDK